MESTSLVFVATNGIGKHELGELIHVLPSGPAFFADPGIF
jgi:hypothetical protein